MKGLTAKQRKFVDNYLQSGNATQAAKTAGYSPKTARQQGQRLLSNVYIQSTIEKRQKKAADKADLSLEWIIKEVKGLAENAKYDGDKLRALDMLMKHVGGYDKNNKLNIDVDAMSEKQIIAIGNFLIKNIK